MEDQVGSLDFAPGEQAILRNCLNAIRGFSTVRVLDYLQLRRVKELLSEEPGREQNGIGNVIAKTPAQEEFVTRIRQGLVALVPRADPNAQKSLERVFRLKSYPPYQRAAVAAKMLGAMLLGAYGVIAAIAGAKKDQPVNLGSIAGLGLAGWLTGAFKGKMQPVEVVNAGPVRSLLEKHKLLGTSTGPRTVESLARMPKKKFDELEALAKGGELDAASLAEKGIILDTDVLNTIANMSADERRTLRGMAQNWARSGQLPRVKELLERGAVTE